MITKFNPNFRTKLLADDFVELEESIEGAIDRLFALRGVYGILTGTPSVGAGTDWTIDIDSGGSGVLEAIDKEGRYVALPTNPFNTGDLSGEFTMPTAGKVKYLTLVVRHARVDSEARRAVPPSGPVDFYYRSTESYEIVILEGVEANPGSATMPALTSEDGVYLADILVENADASFSDTVFTATRLRIDPLKEASDRGLDGVNYTVGFHENRVPVGTVFQFAASSVPTGWLDCDGSEVSRTTYAALFAVIGTTWGAGDTTTTFNIPDLRGRAPIGVGTGSGLTARALASNGGGETHTIAENNLPPHAHSLASHVHDLGSHTHNITSRAAPAANYDKVTMGAASTGTEYTQVTGAASGNTGAASGNTGNGSGTSAAISNMQPWAALKFIIKT